MEYTAEQKHILDIAANMNPCEVLKINACAGSGKTFILMELMKAHPNKKFLYIVFNAAMKEEAEKRITYSNVRVCTSHALAKQELGIGKIVARHELADYAEILKKDVKLLRNEKFSDKLKSFCASDDVKFPDNDIAIIFDKLHSGELIYTHDLYLKEYQMRLALGSIQLDRYDYVLLDEAQDTTQTVYNIFQLATARKIMVGDVNQNIYSFRKTINVLKKETDYEAHLTRCFRCKQFILDNAYELLVDEGHPTDKMESGFSEEILTGSRAILCRTNFSIFKILSQAIQKHCEDSLKLEKDPKQYLAETVDLYYFMSGLNDEAIEKKHIANFEKIIKQYKLHSIEEYFDNDFCDNYELQNAYDTVNSRQEEVIEIYNAACRIFKNKSNIKNRVSLTTCHLAKGREWDKVIIYSDTDIERPYKILQHKLISIDAMKKISKAEKERRKDEARQQYKIDRVNEVNLYYVSMTRAKSELLDYSAQAMDGKAEIRQKAADKAIAEMLEIKDADIPALPDLEQLEPTVISPTATDTEIQQLRHEMAAMNAKMEKMECMLSEILAQLKSNPSVSEDRKLEPVRKRKSKISDDMISKILKLRKKGLKLQEISKKVGVSTTSVRNVLLKNNCP